MSLRPAATLRIDAGDKQAAEDYFRSGPPSPCIFTHAVDHWPATDKWRFDFFAREYGEEAEPQFNPEAPDFARFPAMDGQAVHQGTLAPGEMLIIPPKWWHYTRSIDHALILSHNFFNQSNLSGYLRGLLGSVLSAKDREALLANLAKRLGAETGPETTNAPD